MLTRDQTLWTSSEAEPSAEAPAASAEPAAEAPKAESTEPAAAEAKA
jgi:14-3-3 protein epsilon